MSRWRSIFTTNPGGSWNDSETFVIIEKIPESLGDEVVGARLVDIEVWVEDPPADAVVNNGIVYVNGIQAASFSGTGCRVCQPVSLLNPGVPALITRTSGHRRAYRVLESIPA